MIKLDDLNITGEESRKIISFFESRAGEKMKNRIEFIRDQHLTRAMGFGQGGISNDEVLNQTARAGALQEILNDIESLIYADKLNKSEEGGKSFHRQSD